MARSPYPFSDRELLNRIARSAGGKAGYKQLVRELGLGGGRERRLLLEQLTRMVAARQLRQLEKELWAVPASTQSDPDPSGPLTERSKRPARPSPSVQQTPQYSGRDRLLSGRLDLHRDGYGFVRLNTRLPSHLAPAVPLQDIFIPPNSLHGAMHGDDVLVQVDEPGREGRLSGRIARVLTRRNPTLVGIFHIGPPRGRPRGRAPQTEFHGWGPWGGHFVQPLDERLGGPIEIPEGAELPAFGQQPLHRTIGEETAGKRNESAAIGSEKWPRRLSEFETTEAPESASGTPGEGSARQYRDSQRSTSGSSFERAESLDGMAVEVEITSFALAGRPARGRVVEVLGPPDAFGVDVEIIIRKHGIPHTFPAHVLAEADERAAARLAPEELERREDFRAFPAVTIDGETARDFDDAVFVRPLANGNFELHVHIADVSWYVASGSALDTEARLRGTSVYFPDRAVPMLPHALSSGICSLLPSEDRLVQSCIMELDPKGEIAGFRVAEGIIRSARRMTYTAVQRCLNAAPGASQWNAHARITPEPTAEDQLERERLGLEHPGLPDAFDTMLDLALRLNRKRVRRGSIDFDLPEPVVQFDPDGNMKAIVRSERGWAHRLIEEFMLSANECVATWLRDTGISALYRIHEMPDPKRILEFEETAAAFGQTLGIGALPVRRMAVRADRRDAQRRSARGRPGRAAQPPELPERIPVTPQMYQRLVRRIQGNPEERILSYLLLRSLKQARYSEKNEGHFALASPFYTHFTSPIRRYPDLIVHRLLRAMLRRGADPHGGPVHSADPQPWNGDSVPDRNTGLPDAANVGSPETRQPLVRTRRKRSDATPQAEQRIGWSTDDSQAPRPEKLSHRAAPPNPGDPISPEELADIAVESSQAERRAADAERELIEWKKLKFMADKIGQDFTGIILSVTKFGFFVELDDLFIEGLVPLGSLTGDSYMFRDTDRVICGASNGHCFRIGDHVNVILDRIDRQQRRLQFALTPGTEPQGSAGERSIRTTRSDAKRARADERRAAKQASRKSGRKQRKH